MKTGQIRKALSGFYYVYADGILYQTRGRGNFRVKDTSPLVGDYVTFESENESEGILLSIEPRKNELVRPPVANLDAGVIVMSAVEPAFSSYLVDRFLVYLESQHIDPIIYITKTDLLSTDEITELEETMSYYEACGYPVFLASEGAIERLLETVGKRTLVFMGQSGVGKSTLLNELVPELDLKTGEISNALGRGKHTTRHVELIPVADALIADTPGFSTVDLVQVDADELGDLFPEFLRNRDDCRFSGCHHLNEPGCRIKEMVESKEIWPERYEHYLQFLDEIKNRKPLYRRNK